MDKDTDDGAEEAALWLAFAKRFLEPDSYQLGAALAWMLGAYGTRAAIAALERAERMHSEYNQFTCNEAAMILRGTLEEQA